MILNITVIQGPQGCGKTTLMRDEALNNSGLYVFACPSIELIREQVEWLRQNDPAISVHEAHSGTKGAMCVAKKIDNAKNEIDAAGAHHAFLFITHEALMSHDFSGFTGWHMRVDEAPASLQAGKIKAKISKKFVRDKLRMVETVGDWSHYVSATAIKWTDADGDTIASKASSFFKQANRQTGIFINDKALTDTDEYVWFSFWSPTYLKNFASIDISASGYFSSLGYKATNQFYGNGCTFTQRNVPAVRTGQPSIDIFYMTGTHKGSTSFWKKTEGRKCLVEVCSYFAKAVPDLGFWSGNEHVYELFEHRLAGEYISPKAKGLNKFRNKESCAFIFSSKATQDDRAIIEAMDVSHADILADREDEDVRQFVMRGAIRNFDYSGSYQIYLYEKTQADMLQAHLTNSGFNNVSIAQAMVPHTASYVRTDESKSKPDAAEAKEKRKTQNRDSQRRRREKLKQS